MSNKGLIKTIEAASILLHGDPNEEFQLELEEFIFYGHILTCYVGKYGIIVLKTLIGTFWMWHEDDTLYNILNECSSLVCCSL